MLSAFKSFVFWFTVPTKKKVSEFAIGLQKNNGDGQVDYVNDSTECKRFCWREAGFLAVC